MPKQVHVELVGSCRKVENDGFDDKNGARVQMTRVKIMTGSMENDDEQIYDINYIWKPEQEGGLPVRPGFLKALKKGEACKIPVRVVANGNQVEVRGI